MTTARRVIVALALLAGLAGTQPGPAAAEEPARPLPGYRPAFATETDVPPPWIDCLWASAEMFLDKLTSGQLRVRHERLRVLSRDRDMGSNLADVQAAFARLGQPMTYSPDGGEVIKWPGLLTRLEAGGGAILLGDYGRLPQRYGRFDRDFWSRTGDLDNHALYLDAYDAVHDRIWVMDPLAPAGWNGEWVPRKALVKYAWQTRGGGLSAAMTPVAEAAPFDGVALGEPTAAVSPGRLTVSWPIATRPDDWVPPGTSIAASVLPLDSGIVPSGPDLLIVPRLAALDGPSGLIDAVAPPLPAPELAESPDSLTLGLPLPELAGAYRVEVSLVENRFGGTVARAGPYILYVPGEVGVSYGLDRSPRTVVAGSDVVVTGFISNTGTSTWDDPVPGGAIPASELEARQTTLWAWWLSEDPELAGVGPTPVRLGSTRLAPGEMAPLSVALPAPLIAGRWSLAFDVADMAGSFAARGSAPAALPITVTDVPVREAR